MEKLLPYYERELAILRSYMRELAQRFPKLAEMLGLSGERCTDDAAEGAIQVTALLCARIGWRLAHGHQRFTNDLLGNLAPFYLRPIPSCSVIQMEGANGRSGTTIPRGTELRTSAIPACGFRTVYDVDLAPIEVTAHFMPRAEVPATLGLPRDIGCAIAITVKTMDAAMTLEEAAGPCARIFIDIDGPARTAFHDALFMRAMCTCVEADRRWHKLPALPFAPVGLATEEAMLPMPWRQEESLRLLTEYFAFPEKFDFFDIDMKAVLAGCPPGTRQAILHVLLPDLHRTATPNLLRTIPADALRLGCTPVINMFSQKTEPIRLRKRSKAYPLALPRSTDAKATVYGIDAMKLARSAQEGGTTVDMAWFHDREHEVHHCWLFELANPTLGTGDMVSFVDRVQTPLALSDGTVECRVTCTNGDLPCALPIGRADGDLVGMRDIGCGTIRMLRKPTAPLDLAHHPEAHWQLIAIAHASQRNDAQQHVRPLLHLLRMHARPGSAVTERQLSGILGVSRSIFSEWIKHKKGCSLDKGYEIAITIDEAAFTERSIVVFAKVMERVLAYYLLQFNFIRLNIVGKDGHELIKGALVNGTQSPA